MSGVANEVFRNIQFLKSQYNERAIIFLDNHLHIMVDRKNTGFLGSSRELYLSSLGFIDHSSPACIAAPQINMVAEKSIFLGWKKDRNVADQMPVRIYAPEKINISATNIYIGNVCFIRSVAFIGGVEVELDTKLSGFCEKLFFTSEAQNNTELFEFVKRSIAHVSIATITLE